MLLGLNNTTVRQHGPSSSVRGGSGAVGGRYKQPQKGGPSDSSLGAPTRHAAGRRLRVLHSILDQAVPRRALAATWVAGAGQQKWRVGDRFQLVEVRRSSTGAGVGRAVAVGLWLAIP